MKESNLRKIAFAIFGLIVLITGLILMKTIQSQGIMKALPYVCVVIGCVTFGYNLGETLRKKALDKSPDIAKNIVIEQNDERNIIITNKAKARAYDVMIYVYGALLVAFGLMQVELTTIIILVTSYLFVVFSGIHFRCKYEKEM